MSKKRKTRHKLYVNHPRYGDKLIYSGASFPLSEILQAHWQYDEKSIFPETAILANTDVQNYSVFPIKIYVDIEKICRSCKRWFIFFAQEQKYWFEMLKFYVDADCMRCIDCRKKAQNVQQMLNDYERLIKIEERSKEETARLKYIALELFQLGYIKNKEKINDIDSRFNKS